VQRFSLHAGGFSRAGRVYAPYGFADVTGIDLNDPPEMQLPELLSVYEVGVPLEAQA
jgi:hypothetical protein